MAWIPVGKILPEKISALKLEEAMSLWGLRKDWDEILIGTLGPKWQKKTKPIKLKNKVLIIACRNSVWANELQLKEKLLLNKIRNKVKEIEKLKFVS